MSPSPEVVTKVSSKRALWANLETIVGKANLREASEADSVDGMPAEMVAEPGNEAELAAILLAADTADCKVMPRGAGSKLDWGNRPLAPDLILSTARLDQVLEHAFGDMTATVEAGCTVEKVQNTLAKHGQRLAIDPLWPERATIGGILSTNDSGSLRVRFGSLRDLIIGVTMVLSDGTIAKSGGKVVKNVAGYDLPKLVTGALGTLGVITTAVFRLHPLPAETRSITVSADSTSALQSLATAIHDSQLAYTGLQLRVESGSSPNLDIRFEGTAAGIAAQVKHLSTMCAQLSTTVAEESVWKSRDSLFSSASNSVTAKFSVLPTELSNFCQAVGRILEGKCNWRIIAQSVGVGLIHIFCADMNASAEVIQKLRSQAGKLGTLGQMSGGSLLVLRCPAEMKAKFDVWGPTSDAQSLFVSVKRQFDPRGTLNPGRFIGGI